LLDQDLLDEHGDLVWVAVGLELLPLLRQRHVDGAFVMVNHAFEPKALEFRTASGCERVDLGAR
jgi:hypothetical protein